MTGTRLKEGCLWFDEKVERVGKTTVREKIIRKLRGMRKKRAGGTVLMSCC